MAPMLAIDDADAKFLKQQIALGEAVLVLGAGASFTSTNAQGEIVKQSADLARTVAERAGLPYSGESLPIVLGAVKAVLGDQGLLQIYRREYRGTNPSKELSDLLKFTWKRLYTWCIDDTVENTSGPRSQRLRPYNGMIDSVEESDGPLYLQYVKLHGDINRADRGLVMTESEYAAVIANGKHAWYKKCAQDYLAHTPIFIGSRLSEPILQAELARASRDGEVIVGRAFLITPDDLTPIEIANFRHRGIVHIRSTLREFVRWVQSEFPAGLSPKDVLSKSNSFSGSEQLTSISEDDISIARSLYPIDVSQAKAKAASASPPDVERRARQFLRGAPPSWDIIAASIPVWLSPTTDLFLEMKAAIEGRRRLFVVTGQSGSGKTTAVMQSLMRYGQEIQSSRIYELRGEVKSVRSALSLLEKFHRESQVILYVPDLFVHGDTFGDDIESISSGRITIIATCRQGEWRESLQPYLGHLADPHEYSRFRRVDYQPLIDLLLKYVPSPAFNKLSPPARIDKIAKSRDQLLIALRETTESQNFTDTITNEFHKLPDDDTKTLLLIVGIATVARVGIDVGVAREVYSRLSSDRPFDAAMAALDGIVIPISGSRLFARHELYVRHLIDNAFRLKEVIECVVEILRTYTKYQIPIVRHVNRVDAALFRFCLNHDFIYKQCKTRSGVELGENLYSQFEIQFQLDGHYWLQYGLYLKACGRLDDALTMLQRSIKAFPDNIFAVHAYAELQLQVAIRRDSYDAIAVELVGRAVKTLLELDASGENSDQYPMITLAHLHVGVLVKHGERAAAKAAAKGYFARIQILEKRHSAPVIVQAKERLLKFITLDQWSSDGSSSSSKRRKRVRRRRP